MSETQFMGLLIGCVATLIGIATGIVALIVKPIINLNKSITKLNDSIDQLNGANETLEKRVTQHGKQIDNIRERTLTNEHEIKYLKEKLR